MVGSFEWASAVIGLVAALALFRFKAGVISVVLGAGLAGLVFQLGEARVLSAVAAVVMPEWVLR